MSNLPAIQDNNKTTTHRLYMWKAESTRTCRPTYEDHGNNINGGGDNSNSTAGPNPQKGHGEEKRNNDKPVFTSFPNIPKEIRLKIWELVACGDPKTVDIWAHLKLDITSDESTWSQHIPEEYLKYMTLSKAKDVPSILHVCHEARTIGLKYYTPEVETKGAFNLPSNLDRVVTPRIWVNWAVDTLLLGTCSERLLGTQSRHYFRIEDFGMLHHVEMVLKHLPRGMATLALHHTDVNFIQQSNLIDYPGEIILYRFTEASFPKKVIGVPDSHPMSAYSLILSGPGILQSADFGLTIWHLMSDNRLHWMISQKGDDWKRPNVKLRVWGQPDHQPDLWDDTSPVPDCLTNELGWTGLLILFQTCLLNNTLVHNIFDLLCCKPNSRLLQLDLANCNISKYHTTLSAFRHLPADTCHRHLQSFKTTRQRNIPTATTLVCRFYVLPRANLYAKFSVPSNRPLATLNILVSPTSVLCRPAQPAQPVQRSLEAPDSFELRLWLWHSNVAGSTAAPRVTAACASAAGLGYITEGQKSKMTLEVETMSLEQLTQHPHSEDMRSYVIARQVALLQ
ncbi:hypothetical protein HYFRA_00013673 [Hymenoscyphus fraxineus]|uniref:2EXR domain-containing protein n=1 Tax=Hymenoscyphus fraxineus TaxID=746836 RepID=A0A9N9LCB4_9HELO|nr:hypothetical protein HYFRA_00013673 [Hymenoscyphus fraxineus]